MRQLTVPRASLARSAAFAAAWRSGPAHRTAARAFAGVGDDPVAVAAAAEALFRDASWLDDGLTRLIAGLAADPWFDPPVRTSRDPLRSGAILFDDPAVTVALSVTSAERLRAQPPPALVIVGGRIVVTHYLRVGGATLRRWRVPRLVEPCLAAAMGHCREEAALLVTDGAIVRLDGRSAAHVLVAPTADVVALTATIRAGQDPVARAYDAASGAFVRMATTDDGAARAQLLLSLLRASGGGSEAGAACFDAATRDGAFFLRWAAMREWLAADGRRAWPRLEEMAAGDPHPEVRAAALATRDQLRRLAA